MNNKPESDYIGSGLLLMFIGVVMSALTFGQILIVAGGGLIIAALAIGIDK